MDNKRPLLPSFLQKFDKKLLLQKPETWSARTHLVLYYGFLFMLALAAICFVIPNDARSRSTVGYWVAFVIIISIIAFVFWMIYLLRFNVFKRFGNITAIGRLKTFVLYFIAVGTIVFFTYVPAIVETVRANLKYSDEEIVQDINIINTSILQLNYDEYNHYWSKDSFYVVDTIPKHYEIGPDNEVHTTTKIDTLVTVSNQDKKFTYIDTADWRRKIENADSVFNIRDSLYIVSTCPSYDKLRVYNADNYTKTKVYTAKDLFYKIVQNYKKPTNANTIAAQLNRVLAKYKYDEYNYQYNQDLWSEKYHLNTTDNNLTNIVERKYRFDKAALPWEIRLWFYFTLVLTLLVFIFRHSTVKTFFLSLLAIVVLSILTGLLITFSNSFETSIYGWFIFYVIIFAAIAFATHSAGTRNAINGIGINLFTLGIAFLPLASVALYNGILRKRYYDSSSGYYEAEHKIVEQYFYYAEILGIALLLVLIPTVLHQLYKKWYALPEE